ncbi:glycerol-3-phosphate dehydrogenase/oxidase [Catenulispora sp. NF23]|uniref:Glycerol-3-phosphate dehydrogenase n=2 Tax=Catenulispora pinistramenti TaxID=2705254 RepID=A0ABS5L7V8_9ACTN|nr:glycerol-3-phosphate dehydrogenase/oxidase [Catenulispora pinistramenti]MBS2539617.1 glycerol-3-phosphate dehydrogenase/oxidase [Catenulispora pinistramenti]MBS2554409.1 glycerol-3-phosphate dehydrogenase/oxidase [Catenulispora pinistramenti]
MQSIPLGPAHRLAALQQMADEEFDVLIVGGGVVGAGAALDAASRGLSVALVEARDWAAGTSSRSSKLIHGGLRYLEQRDFGLVREALTERSLLLNRIAPHLVRPVPFLLPLRHRVWERAYIGAGVLLYDTMGGARALPRHRHLTKSAALRQGPGLNPDTMVGAIQYYDAQVDDARFTMALARTAAQHGAQVATRARVTGFLRDGGRVTGAVVHDLEGDRSIEIRARRVICATGVWTDDVRELANAPATVTVRASKGVHLVVPRDRIELKTGLIARTEKSVLFIIPWGRHWLIGTTDTAWDLDRNHPAASRADIEYLLEHVNAVLNEPLTPDDIEGVYVGLRPLVSGTADETTKLSREHIVTSPAPGLTFVTGGKFTTYRVMAKDAVDAAVADLGTDIPASVTDQVTVLGAERFAALRNERRRLAQRSGLNPARVEHLLYRYGSCIYELLELIDADRTLAEPIAGARDYLRVEAVYAASHEGALHVEDVLNRRTRIAIEETDRGLEAASEVADLIAPILGWTPETTNQEVERYLGQVQAEREAESRTDDSAADEARRAAPDLFDVGVG